MPAKPKNKPRSAKATEAKAYDNRLYREYERGELTDDPEGENAFMREVYFRRRHLRCGRDENGRRRLEYEISSEWFFELMDGGLEEIMERDGKQIFNEVARRLLIEAIIQIKHLGGSLPKVAVQLLKELIAERRAEEDEIDAYLKRRARPMAIAA
jgi:hypothetical protein